MQRQLGVRLAHAHGEAEIGDDERVEAGEIRRLQRRQRRPDLVVLEQGVERQVRARVVEMSRLDRLDGRLAGEVAGEGARAPALETEVDGVGAGRQGRAQRARLAGRRQQFDVSRGRHVGDAFTSPRGGGAQRAGSAPGSSLTTLPLLVAVHADEAAGGDRLHAVALELVEEEVDAQRVAAHVPGDDHVDAVLVGLVAQLLAHVHADDRADAAVGELLDDRLGALGAAGHVDPHLAGTGAGAALAEVRAGALLRGDAVLGDLEQRLLHVFDERAASSWRSTC